MLSKCKKCDKPEYFGKLCQKHYLKALKKQGYDDVKEEMII